MQRNLRKCYKTRDHKIETTVVFYTTGTHTYTHTHTHTHIRMCCNLLSFLLRCGARLYEWSTE